MIETDTLSTETKVQGEVTETESTLFANFTSKDAAHAELVKCDSRMDALLKQQDMLSKQIETNRTYYKALAHFTEKQWGPLGSLNLVHLEFKEDLRKKANPTKNLKISAIRCFRWAKHKGHTADVAKARAILKTNEKARVNHNMSELPSEVQMYIECLYQDYNNFDASEPVMEIVSE